MRAPAAIVVAVAVLATASCGARSTAPPDEPEPTLNASEVAGDRVGRSSAKLTPELVDDTTASGWVSVSSTAFAATAFSPSDSDEAVLYSIQLGDKRAAPAFEGPDSTSVQVGFFIEGNMGLVPQDVALDPVAHECFDRVDSGAMTLASVDSACKQVFIAAGYDLAAGRFPAAGRSAS